MAPFIDNVSDYVSSHEEVEPTLRSFQEMISKYQFMEVNTQRRGQGLREKIPDIKKTLEMVRFLKLRKEVRRNQPWSSDKLLAILMDYHELILFFLRGTGQPRHRP